MSKDLSRIYPVRKTGAEPLHDDGNSLGPTLLDFWSWSLSDLVSNANRGILAEFIVACALGINLQDCRDEWGAFDLETSEHISIEVKSAAYVQSWFQRTFSPIVFRIPKTRAWTAESNLLEELPNRKAQVYVFALLAHKGKQSIDPLNVEQWRFYVLPTSILDQRKRSQQSITLRSLESLAGFGIHYADLREAVQSAGKATVSSPSPRINL